MTYSLDHRVAVTSRNQVASGSSLELKEHCSSVSFCAYGVKFELHVPDALLSQLAWPIVPGAEFTEKGQADAALTVHERQSAEGEAGYEIFENGAALSIVNNLEAAIRGVEAWAQLTVATLAKELVFVHAGVIGWKGRAIVVPGRSLSGKSTLVLSFVRHGADYYSDEYAIFDSEGRVHPYWRQPKLRVRSDQDMATSLVGGRLKGAPPKPMPLGWVLISRYEAGSRWHPRRLSKGGTMLGLLDNTVPLRSRPEQSVKVLATAVKNAQGFEGTRGEAADFAEQVLASLASPGFGVAASFRPAADDLKADATG